MRKPTFCICENKDADQLRGNREADQRLCFRYIDKIPLLSKYEISSLSPTCVTLQPGLCWTWSETPNTGFLTTRLIYLFARTGHCKSYEYRCRNERCISHSLRCRGHDPCGDDSDCLMTIGAMAAIALGCACAVGFLTSVIFVVYKNRKRLYRKHKRQPHTFTPVSK